MRKLSIKNFIAYNNPCFCCGQTISIKIGATSLEGKDTVYLSPLVSPETVEVDLKITYNSSLKLIIDHKTNKFKTNNWRQFLEYLRGRNLFMNSICKCHASLCSQHLSFNFDEEIIAPVSIEKENYIITHGDFLYHVWSDLSNKKTHIVMDKINNSTPLSPVQFELPFTSLRSFKSLDRFAEKMKTYLIFS